MKKLKIAALSLIALLGVATFVPSYALASPASEVQQGVNSIGGRGQDNLESSVETVVNVLLFVAGAIAVVMIIIGGIRYVIAGGEQSHVKAAKDTIMYSIIGLVIVMLAYAVVNFVVGAFA